MKRLNLVFIALLLIPLASCSVGTNDDNVQFSEKKYTFNNLSQEYDIPESSLNTYFLPDTQIPYVDVREFLNSVNGLLNSDEIKGKVTRFQNQLTLSVPISGSILSFACIINWEKNTIDVNSTTFFSAAMNTPQASDFASHQKVVGSGYGDPNVDLSYTYDLGKYGIEIYYYQGKVLLPFSILNLLFCSQNMYNVYFNGNGYFGIDYYLNPNDSSYESIVAGSSFSGKDRNEKDSEFTLNFLDFTLDNFYGLKDYFKIDSFKNYMEDRKIDGNILSTDPKDNYKGYLDLFIKNLDEMHTSVISPSFYTVFSSEDEDNSLKQQYLGENRIKFNQTALELKAAQDKVVGQGNPYPTITYSSDNSTAVLHFNEFSVGTKSQIEGSEPWKYDTYELFKYFFNEISSKPVENVVIDLSNNGGGTLAAMIKSLGFLTDGDIPLAYTDSQTKLQIYQNYRVDVDGDGEFGYRESYSSKYKFAVLASNYTYSAANYFTELFKAKGMGKVLGQQSGGGMCAVLPIVLPDGTCVAISGTTQLNVYDSTNNSFTEVQSGVAPDIKLSYDQFYDPNELSIWF